MIYVSTINSCELERIVVMNPVNVDLTEIITVSPEMYPCPMAKELLGSVCDEPFLVYIKLEELLPRFK